MLYTDRQTDRLTDRQTQTDRQKDVVHVQIISKTIVDALGDRLDSVIQVSGSILQHMQEQSLSLDCKIPESHVHTQQSKLQ